MASKQVTITLTPELAGVLDRLAEIWGMERSRLVETLLREHPRIRETVEVWRSAPPTKKGRPLADLMALARSARRQWNKKVASGTVAYPGGR